MQTIPFRIEPMKAADIEPVVALEQAAYGRNRSPRDYRHELRHNKLAHYFVLGCDRAAGSTIIGQGGFWLLVDEVHITTVAIQPNWQRLGLGAWLLIHLLEQGRMLGGAVATLEVRPSNQIAINLYTKYHFREVGRRPHYYSDNGEDALILMTPTLTLPEYQTRLRQHKSTLLERLARLNIDKIEYLN